MHTSLEKLSHGMTAGLLSVLAYRIADRTLTIVDWAIIVAIAGVAITRALAAVAGPFSAMLTHTFLYLLGSAIVEMLSFLRLLAEAERVALRKRLRARFVRQL